MTTIQIKVPNWLDFIFACPLLIYRCFRFGCAYRRIYLGEGRFTIVGPRDFYRLNYFHWTIDGKKESIYAIRNIISANGKTKIVRMHREIMNAPDGLLVDHKNGDSLDNRRINLRLATRSQNCCNVRKRKNTSSRFKGVCFYKAYQKWSAYINVAGRRKYLGYFDSEIEAARTYDEAAKKYRGEFARLNFPD